VAVGAKRLARAKASRPGAFSSGVIRLCTNALPVAPLVDHDLVCRKVLVRDKDVVFVKGLRSERRSGCPVWRSGEES